MYELPELITYALIVDYTYPAAKMSYYYWWPLYRSFEECAIWTDVWREVLSNIPGAVIRTLGCSPL